MIFGPRKWFSKKYSVADSHSIHDYQFQWKYIATFSSILILGFTGTSLPLLYLFSKNYAIFEKLSFDLYPNLVENLYQEKNWIWILFGIGLFVLFGFTLYFSHKFTNRILNSVHQVEKHLHQMMLGNWSQPIVFDEAKEDFKTLKISYDYFQRSIKANTEMELNLLQKIVVDPNNRDSYLAWKNLIEAKAQRVGIDPELILNNNQKMPSEVIEINFKKNSLKAS